MPVKHDDLINTPCSIIRPLAVMGDRWTFMLVKEAFDGVRRFEQFQSRLGISRGRLSDRLERLVREGVLRLSPYEDGARVRNEYRLTQKGRDLYPVMLALREWGDRYMAPDGPPMYYRHTGCGGESHARVFCDECGEEIGPREVTPEPGPGMDAPRPDADLPLIR